MARLSRADRTRTWQQRLDRFAKSDQTVTDFCKAEGVSMPSFYQWKRRLGTPQGDSPAANGKTRKQREVQASNAAVRPFTELVVTGQSGTAQAQLPNGVSISLGHDQAIAAAIVDRLLAYEPATASSSSRSASRSSC